MFSKKIKKVVKIEGMHCEHCSKKVTETLSSLAGVTNVKVNLSKKEAVITSTSEIDNNAIKEAIASLDFQVIEIN